MNEDIRKNLSLKRKEPEVPKNGSIKEIWAHDVLERSNAAEKLTRVVKGHTESLVVGLHGAWGSGKTFFLKRWQKELETEGIESIYFNAWEDDFYSDPLVAIVGQLSVHFEENEKYKKITKEIKELATNLITKAALTSVKSFTGLDVEGALEKAADKTFEAYTSQRESREKLRSQLEKLSKKVRTETGTPLVFIVDELDRCRPTFAIELLERVKHIFDIPSMVFVFGINREELCNTITSVYGDIDSDVYLRRFFDLDLLLPPADSGNFCSHLIKEYGLEYFSSKSSESVNRGVHQTDIRQFGDYFPLFCSRLNLSLRDIDHCIRSVVFVDKTIQGGGFMHPYIIGALIVLRLKERSLYKKLIQKKCFTSEVIDYFEEQLSLGGFESGDASNLIHCLNVIEGELYRLENPLSSFEPAQSEPIYQLNLLKNGDELTYPRCLSKRAQKLQHDDENLKTIIEINQDAVFGISLSIQHIADLIELAGPK